MKSVPRIPVCPVTHKLTVAHSDTPAISTASAAERVFLDFSDHPPMLLDPDVSIDDAAYLMGVTHASLKLVTDARRQLLGIITRRDIESVKVLATASAMGVARADLTVRDIMVPTVRLQAIGRAVLARANVGDLVEVMEFAGQRFLLVVDEREQLCGLVSADELSHRLGRPLDIEPVAQNFGQIFSALKVS